MDRKSLENEILELLKDSGVPIHEKTMTKILLPVMEIENLQNVYKALMQEKEQLEKLSKKEKRVQLKYKVMFDRMAK